MKSILAIKFEDQYSDNEVNQYRKAARAILFDNQGLIPMLLVSEGGYHKLPGGGIEENETILEALIRESLEETGCKIEIGEEIGEIKEYRLKWNLEQVSYCYFGKIIEKGEPSFTEDELQGGFQLIWTTIDKAISMLEKDSPTDYEGAFIKQRDLAFLKEAKRIRDNK